MAGSAPSAGPALALEESSATRSLRASRDAWMVIACAVALLALTAGVVAFALAPESSGGTASGALGSPQMVEVEIAEFYVEPPSIEVSAGTELTVVVTNAGTMPHDLKLDGDAGTGMLDPGASETVSLGVIEDDAQAWCTVPGHKEAGMVMDITVTGSVASGGEHVSVTGETGDGAQIDFAAAPAADWAPFDPRLEPAPGGTEHTLTFRATETVTEVAPGVTQELWLFNDQFPGPVLRGRVGDIFTVTVVNEGKLGHSLDFHASKVAWNDEMRTLQPGEELVYQFEAGRVRWSV